MTIELNTSQRDPKLMEQTLRAFKSDPLLRECYMSSAEYKQQDITQLAAKHDVSWTAAGTDIPTGLLADQYSFSVEVNLPSSMQISGLPIAKDRSKYFSGFKLQMPVEMKTEGAQNVEAGAKAIKQGSSVAPGAAPAEVK